MAGAGAKAFSRSARHAMVSRDGCIPPADSTTSAHQACYQLGVLAMPEKPSRSALKVCVIYAMAAGAWILLSDRAVAFLLPDAHRITSFQTLKGLAFVLTTSGLLYLVMRRQLRRQWEEQGRRQNAEIARTQSQQQIRALFEAEPECLEVLEPDSTARHINPAGLSLIEADNAAQVLGKPLLPLVVPEDRAAVSAVLEAAARGERGGLEFRITTLKGTERWIEMRAAPFQDLESKRPLILALSRDISSRKQTEAALSLSKERLRACIESSPNVAVQWYDESGQVIFWNQASEVMFGWAANEALGRKRDELTQTATQAARFGETLQEIKRTGTKNRPAGKRVSSQGWQPGGLPFHRVRHPIRRPPVVLRVHGRGRDRARALPAGVAAISLPLAGHAGGHRRRNPRGGRGRASRQFQPEIRGHVVHSRRSARTTPRRRRG